MREESNRRGQIGSYPMWRAQSQMWRPKARGMAPGSAFLPMGQQKTQQLRSSDAASGVVTTGPQAGCRGGLEAKPLNAKQLRSDRGNGISIVANRFGRRDEELMPPPRSPVRRGVCGQAAHREILHSLKTVSLQGDEDN